MRYFTIIYTVVFPQFLIFQQNNSAQTSVIFLFTSRYYYNFDKLKIVKKKPSLIKLLLW